ncbi:MAG: hypothetical protein JWM80_4473 [Cyanobacteria bacterium RYN_339]|nr:hypothetical protein [Cyanobacteria bacterium RYN_339]
MKRAAIGSCIALSCLATACQDKVPTRPTTTTSTKAASAEAFDLPKSVALTLPPALNIVAQGAGNIVAQGAGNIVTNASSNVVAKGSQRRVLAAEPYPFLSTLLPIYMRIYSSSTRKIDLALAALRKAGLKDGMVVTFTDDDPVPALATVTVRYKRVGKQAVVQVCFGPTFDESKLGGVAVFQDAKHGKLLVHPPLPSVKALLLASTFDHELHRASADGLVDGSLVPGGVGPTDGLIPVVASAERYHYEFEELEPAKHQGATFSMAVAAYRTIKEKPEFNGEYGLTANFLPEGGVAAVGGMQTQGTGPTFVWFAGLSKPIADPTQPHTLFGIVQDGALKDWPRNTASDALLAIVPADGSLHKPYPISPLATDLDKDSAFALPIATP